MNASEKSRRVFKKPRCYKDESDGCIDTWIEVMKLHLEEEDLLGETGMQRAHQQLRRDSPELCHGQETVST